MKKTFISAISLSFLVISTLGQNFLLDDLLTSEDGLSQSTVNCILLDKDGFLWIGTQDGLNVYDGYHFTNYQNQPSNPTSLSNNYILSMCEDRDGNIWAGTMSGGLNCLDKKTGRCKNYIHRSDDSTGISDNTIWSLIVDQTGNILAGTSSGLNVYNKANNCFEHYRQNKKDPTGLPSDMILSLLADQSNIVWIGTNIGLARFNIETKKIAVIPSGLTDNENIIWSIANQPESHLLLGTRDGIVEFDKQSFQFKPLWPDESNESFTVWSMLPAKDNCWVGTQKGIKIMNRDFSACYDFDHRLKNYQSNEEENIWCFLKDQSGIIWAGTDRGLVKIKKKPDKFYLLDNDPKKKPYLSGLSINAILIDSEETMWIGTDGQGLNKLAPGDDKCIVYISGNPKQTGPSGNRIWSLLEDRDGILWVGTYGDGLNAFDKTTETFTSYQQNNLKDNWISNNRILTLLEDHTGAIWIGTRGGGLNRYDKEKETFEIFRNNPDDSSSLAANTVISLCEDRDGNIWVGTYEGGLCLYNRPNNSFITFENSPSNPGSISSNNVWSILFDQKNRMWLGTEGGLDFSEKPGKWPVFKHFTTLQGLVSNVIFGLAEDEQGNIWMSSFRGICKLQNSVLNELLAQSLNISDLEYDPFNPLVKIYDKSFGLQGNEFNQGAYYKADNGLIFFGGLEGMNYFDPKEIKESDFSPNVVITNFKIFNKEVHILPDSNQQELRKKRIIKRNGSYYLTSKITGLDELILTYRESVFSFDFASLDYTNSVKNQYAYIMEGFDQDWNFVANQTSATYTNLDPGEYIFRVKGTNAENNWSRNEARLKIEIIPPLWRTTWFILLMVFVAIITLVYSIWRIIQNNKRKTLAEKERIELQLKTIKNQIDPHFAFNALNMIGSLVYKNDPDTVYDYFSRFAKLIRNTLQDSAKIARPLKDEIEFVNNYVEIQKTRFKNKFDFKITVDDSIDLRIQVPKMIIQTYVENAIKHGLMHKKEKGLLTIDINQLNGKMKIIITDDGIGRKKAAELNKTSTKKGMQIVTQIFSMYNKLNKHQIRQQINDLYDEHHKACGTQIILTIDLIQQ